MKNENYLVDMSKGKKVYDFKDSKLITSYSNSPQYNRIKNDFVVWGIRKNANGNDVPIRYHLAIDTKPEIGNIYEVFFYDDPEDGLTKAKALSVRKRRLHQTLRLCHRRLCFGASGDCRWDIPRICGGAFGVLLSLACAG